MNEEKILNELKAELKPLQEKAAEQQKEFGTITAALKTQIEAIQKQLDAIDSKIAERHATSTPEPGLREVLSGNEDLVKFMKNRNGNFTFEVSGKHMRELGFKGTDTVDTSIANVITSTDVGAQTTGVLTIQRLPGITPEARQALTIRDLFSARPTNLQLIDFVKVSTPMTQGSPQTEANDKALNAVTFTSVSERIRTLATWIPASRQVLDDMDELMNFLSQSLPYYTNLGEEIQLLSGDGTGQNLHGLITQATAFQTSLLSSAAGWNRIDVVGRAIEQIVNAKELPPTFIVLNPADYWNIRLTKDSYGRYILGDPQEPGPAVQFGGTIRSTANLFGLTPVVTTSIASGTFLVGSGDPVAAEIRDRMGMQVEIATQHADFFTKNLIAIRAEKRTALIVKRPASFITGTFTTSPVVAGQ